MNNVPLLKILGGIPPLNWGKIWQYSSPPIVHVHARKFIKYIQLLKITIPGGKDLVPGGTGALPLL